MKLLIGIGIGYVLGTRAGKERYEQIRVVAKSAAQRMEAYGADGSLASNIGNVRRSVGDAARRDS